MSPLTQWIRNPSYDGGESPFFLVGDRVLIAVPLSKGGYDYEVTTAGEECWDSGQEMWSSWCWSDVEYYIPLDGVRNESEL